MIFSYRRGGTLLSPDSLLEDRENRIRARLTVDLNVFLWTKWW